MTTSNGVGWPGVSIVVPTWNGWALLASYLPSVRAAQAAYPGESEVVVVDDGGTDETAHRLGEQFPEFRVLSHERNQGFSGAVNTGIQAARLPLVLLLNNDIRVEADFLAALAAPFRAPGATDLFATVALQIDPVVEGDERYDGCRRLFFARGELRFTNDTAEALRGAPLRPSFANGGCSLFDREKLVRLGGFCDLFNPFYSEDAEVSVQALKKGWRIEFTPESRVWHRPNSTTARHPAAMNRTQFRNLFYLNWLVLDDPVLWLWHGLYVVPRLVSGTLRGHRELVGGLRDGLKSWRQVRAQRRQRGRDRVRSVRQLLRAG